MQALRQLQAEHGLEGGVTVSDVARFPGALEVVETAPGLDDDRRGRMLGLVREALDGLVAMRSGEGGRLLRGPASAAWTRSLESAGRIESALGFGREARRSALLERPARPRPGAGPGRDPAVPGGHPPVERHDVSEEVQRLRSHVARLASCCRGANPPARSSTSWPRS